MVTMDGTPCIVTRCAQDAHGNVFRKREKGLDVVSLGCLHGTALTTGGCH